MRALDLYAGIGAYTLAMREAGIEVVGAAERDVWRQAVYMQHHGASGVWMFGDVAKALCESPYNATWPSNPNVDLWTACVGVAELERLIREHCNPGPAWLLLESVREPFAGVQAALAERRYHFQQWDACGRRFVMAGPRTLSLQVPDEYLGAKLQHPDVDCRKGVSLEDQEAALGLPRGYTDCRGATEQQRRGALASTSHVGHLTHVLRRIAEVEA